MRSLTLSSLIASIDFTLLDPAATEDKVREVCARALEYSFASVCVRPQWVPLVAELLRGSAVKTCTVISFHHGIHSIRDKVAEARGAIRDGAQEIDWVFNHNTLTSTADVAFSLDVAETEVQAIASFAREFTSIVFKVIIETCALTDEQKIWICQVLATATVGVRIFLKTSTGFGEPRAADVPKGATPADVKLMLATATPINPLVEAKASGGLRTFGNYYEMWLAGATRFGIGWESALKIVEEARGRFAA